MTKEESNREQLKNLRRSISQHMEDAAMLFMQLPEQEHDFCLVNCVAAWELVASQPMTQEQLQGMIETLFSGNDDVEEISGTGGEAA
jgi:hypothetical protein